MQKKFYLTSHRRVSVLILSFDYNSFADCIMISLYADLNGTLQFSTPTVLPGFHSGSLMHQPVRISEKFPRTVWLAAYITVVVTRLPNSISVFIKEMNRPSACANFNPLVMIKFNPFHNLSFTLLTADPILPLYFRTATGRMLNSGSSSWNRTKSIVSSKPTAVPSGPEAIVQQVTC